MAASVNAWARCLWSQQWVISYFIPLFRCQLLFPCWKMNTEFLSTEGYYWNKLHDEKLNTEQKVNLKIKIKKNLVQLFVKHDLSFSLKYTAPSLPCVGNTTRFLFTPSHDLMQICFPTKKVTSCTLNAVRKEGGRAGEKLSRPDWTFNFPFMEHTQRFRKWTLSSLCFLLLL